MPIIQGCSVISVKNNYSMLIKEGYPNKQALAITFNIARKNINQCTPERQRAILIERDFFGERTKARK